MANASEESSPNRGLCSAHNNICRVKGNFLYNPQTSKPQAENEKRKSSPLRNKLFFFEECRQMRHHQPRLCMAVDQLHRLVTLICSFPKPDADSRFVSRRRVRSRLVKMFVQLLEAHAVHFAVGC